LSGMTNEGVSPTVANCLFENNGLEEGRDGGAIRNISNADAHISNSTFINNYRSAIFNDGSSPTIDNSSFINNRSDSGGAIKNKGPNAAPFISNSTFDSNTASRDGGAISNDQADPLIENCSFLGNSAHENGGAISNSESAPTFLNCLFSENTAEKSGGAMYSSKSEPFIINSTIVGNSAEDKSGGVVAEKGDHGRDPTIINSILWNNTDDHNDDQVYNGRSSKTLVSFSDVQGGYDGANNIDTNPNFLSDSDYRLGSGSLCIDAGNNSVVSTTTSDLDGNRRIVDGNSDGQEIVDMGAYEYVP